MKKASYVDRKLTIEEQAAAEKYIYILEIFVRKKHLTPIEEWIERLSVAYIQAIKKYTDYERLHCYKIETIIFKSLEGATANYHKKINCLKRKPLKTVLSYDDQREYNRINFAKVEKDVPNCTEKIALENLMLYDVFQAIEIEQQRRIVIMLVEGYKKVEIQRYFNITYYRLQKEIENIRKIIKQIYFEN